MQPDGASPALLIATLMFEMRPRIGYRYVFAPSLGIITVQTTHHSQLERPREECGLFGVYGVPGAASHIYAGRGALQHRGQEVAGITIRRVFWFFFLPFKTSAAIRKSSIRPLVQDPITT